jgi:hypothetical protein
LQVGVEEEKREHVRRNSPGKELFRTDGEGRKEKERKQVRRDNWNSPLEGKEPSQELSGWWARKQTRRDNWWMTEHRRRDKTELTC